MAKEKRNGQNERMKEEVAVQNDYKIFNYVKDNIGIFAGVGAVIWAVLSAIIGFCSYLYERSMLKYWNVSAAYINQDAQERIYMTIISFAFVCMMFIILAGMNEIADKCMQFKRMQLYRKIVKREYNKTRCELMINNIKTLFMKKRKNTSAQRQAEYAKRALDLLNCSYKSVLKNVKGQCFLQKGVLFVCFAIIVYLWISVGIAGNEGTIEDIVIMAVLVSGILFVPINLSSKSFPMNKKNIKADAKADYIGQRIRTEIPTVTLASKKIFSGEYRFYPSDQKIKRMIPRAIICVLLVTIVFVVMFQFLGYKKAKAQREFMITSRDNGKYAIVYNNGEEVVLASCEEVEDADGIILRIDTNLQRIESVEGLQYTIKVYHDVVPEPIEEKGK